MSQFETFCQENYVCIYKYIMIQVHSKELAEDLTQEVFIAAFTNWEKIKKYTQPKAFLYRTAKNLVTKSYRKKKKEILTDFLSGNEVLENMRGKDTYEVLKEKQDQAIMEENYIDSVFEQLDTKKKSLYKMYYIDHIPMKEIAKKLDINEISLRMRYVRLRRDIIKIAKSLGLSDGEY